MGDSELDSDVDDQEAGDDELRRRLADGSLGSKIKMRAPERIKGSINPELIAARLKEINVSSGLEWAETLIMSEQPLPVVAVNDDLAREAAFLEHTFFAVAKAENCLQVAGIPYNRPNDYYAEMVKTDEHMRKVKEKLLNEKQQIEHAEVSRKQRESKKFGKKVQKDVLDKRQKEKSAMLDQVKRHRTDTKQAATTSSQKREDDFNVSAEDAKAKKYTAPMDKNGNLMPNKRRQAKNAKFGTGGHRNKKSNDADSYLNTKQFSMKKNRSPFREGGQANYRGKGTDDKPGSTKPNRGAKRKAPQRPGKSARKKQRN